MYKIIYRELSVFLGKFSRLLTKVGHIILALLVFIGSTGVVINKHYCQNELKDSKLFVAAEVCHTNQKAKHCPFHPPKEETPVEKKGCCENDSQYLKTEIEQPLQPSDQAEISPILLSTIAVVFNIELPAFDKQTLHYLNYKPPLLVCDFPVSLQTFLC